MSTIRKSEKFSGIIFITGTGTGVGKTAFTALLLAHLRAQGVRALAMKPFCSGGFGDVRLLQSLQHGELSDAEVNPFYYDVPLAPLIAAQKNHGPKVTLRDAVLKIQAVKKKCDLLLVEGSGGVLVPLGEGFSVLDLIGALDCSVVIVGQNKLGIINHAMLSFNVSQSIELKEVMCVLIDSKKRDISAFSNAVFLSDRIGLDRIFELPFFEGGLGRDGRVKESAKKIKKVLARFCEAAILHPSSIRKTELVDKKPVDGRRGER